MTHASMERYFQGQALYGDDFDAAQIAAWYADEAEGYADLGARDQQRYQYAYHAWNHLHGFRHLPAGPLPNVLGFGSAYGDELQPVLARTGAVTVVDPSEAFVRPDIDGVPCRYLRPEPSGDLSLGSNEFDLVTCLGVLHHIPNVSHVLGELARVTRPGGHLLVREPIVSMGDWRHPRRGLTRRERGIPLAVMERIIHQCGLTVERRTLCDFPLTPRLLRPLVGQVFNSPLATRLDALMSAAFGFNINYHPRTAWHRLRPISAFFVLRKPAPSPR